MLDESNGWTLTELRAQNLRRNLGEIKDKGDIRPLNTATSLLDHSRRCRKLKFITFLLNFSPIQEDVWIHMHGILRVKCHKLECSDDLHAFPTLWCFPRLNLSSLKIDSGCCVMWTSKLKKDQPHSWFCCCRKNKFLLLPILAVGNYAFSQLHTNL